MEQQTSYSWQKAASAVLRMQRATGVRPATKQSQALFAVCKFAVETYR